MLDTDPMHRHLARHVAAVRPSFSLCRWRSMYHVHGSRGSTWLHNTGQRLRLVPRAASRARRRARPTGSPTSARFRGPQKKPSRLAGAELPADLVPALPALSKGFLYDQRALSQAEALAERIAPAELATLRPEVPQLGLKARLQGRPLADWAAELLDIAHAGLVRFAVADAEFGADESVHLAPLRALIERGESPAAAATCSIVNEETLLRMNGTPVLAAARAVASSPSL